MTVVEASHPRVCEVCGGDGVVRLLLPGTPIDLCADCPHCVGRIPIVKESKTK